MADIDFFKLYNDRYGHQYGDAILKKIAETINSYCKRISDLAARFGGEEFALVLGNTDSQTAWSIAERICNEIEKLKIPHDSSAVSDFVTASFGIATMNPDRDSGPCDIITIADKQLYKAKLGGRNRIRQCLTR